jgi:hypothetical protein
MPVVLRRSTRQLVLTKTGNDVTYMTMRELVEYEKYLWVCMENVKGDTDVIARRLNVIHREVEWRAQNT